MPSLLVLWSCSVILFPFFVPIQRAAVALANGLYVPLGRAKCTRAANRQRVGYLRNFGDILRPESVISLITCHEFDLASAF
jgi:hypothetical protein